MYYVQLLYVCIEKFDIESSIRVINASSIPDTRPTDFILAYYFYLVL